MCTRFAIPLFPLLTKLYLFPFAVAALIYWRDPKKSGIIFGLILGVLLSLAYFSLISVLAYLSLLILSGTVIFRIYKTILQAVQKTSDGHPFKWVKEEPTTLNWHRLNVKYWNKVSIDSVPLNNNTEQILLQQNSKSVSFLTGTFSTWTWRYQLKKCTSSQMLRSHTLTLLLVNCAGCSSLKTLSILSSSVSCCGVSPTLALGSMAWLSSYAVGSLLRYDWRINVVISWLILDTFRTGYHTIFSSYLPLSCYSFVLILFQQGNK